MNQLIKYVIGIDIAKEKFDACLMSVDVQLNYKAKATHKFSNTTGGFKELLQWKHKHCKEKAPVQTLMEASGVYHEKLAIWLTEKEMQVCVVLPNKARKYMQALGLKTKNDKIDAQGLALMCAQHKFDVWQPIAKFYYQLRLLTRHYQNTQEAKAMFFNQHHALQHSGYSSKQVSKQLEKTIAIFEKQVKENKQHIIEHINTNQEVKRKVNQICKIKGVDILTVATILAETNGFELFKNQGQLVSYAGYDVIENQSGNHIGKTRISKKGNSRIRRILHMPAFNVVRFKETSFVNLYQRVYGSTKMKMKAYVAVQKKILVVIYALWKKDQAYQTDYSQKIISGNDEHRVLFPFFSKGESTSSIKIVVPPYSSTTQDELRYNESHEVLFPLSQT
jgi:transposase